jgi:hypothetical protein
MCTENLIPVEGYRPPQQQPPIQCSPIVLKSHQRLHLLAGMNLTIFVLMFLQSEQCLQVHLVLALHRL